MEIPHYVPNTLYFKTQTEVIEHIAKHREAGHTVPEYVDERLKAEASDG